MENKVQPTAKEFINYIKQDFLKSKSRFGVNFDVFYNATLKYLDDAYKEFEKLSKPSKLTQEKDGKKYEFGRNGWQEKEPMGMFAKLKRSKKPPEIKDEGGPAYYMTEKQFKEAKTNVLELPKDTVIERGTYKWSSTAPNSSVEKRKRVAYDSEPNKFYTTVLVGDVLKLKKNWLKKYNVGFWLGEDMTKYTGTKITVIEKPEVDDYEFKARTFDDKEFWFFVDDVTPRRPK